MSLDTRRKSRAFFTSVETKTGNENSPNLYAVNGCKFEGTGMMTFPEKSRQFESDKNKLGSGEHGTAAQLMTMAAPFSYRSCEHPTEIGYFLSYLLGTTDSVSGSGPYTHYLKPLVVSSLALPTFGFQYGDGLTNDTFAGACVNDCTITLPMRAGNGKIDATFNGWANSHYMSNGAFTKLATGTLASGHEAVSSEPIINTKGCSVYIADALETSFGTSSVDFAGEDLGVANYTNITSLVNSLTLTINNGMSLEEKIRAGGSGLVNDWTRGVRAITLELNCRKDTSVVNWNTIADAATQKALEVQWQGPVISTYGGSYRWSFNFFFPVFQVTGVTEDDETPVNEAISTEVFQDDEKQAMYTYFYNNVDGAFNA